MKINIIQATEEYINEIHKIETECFTDPWSKHSFLCEIENEHSFLLAAIDESNNVLGYASLWHIINEGQINNIAVAPWFRKNGVGNLLMEEIFARAKELNMIGLTLEVRKTNTPAIRLYDKFGFKSEGIRKNYYEFPTEDAIVMWKYMEATHDS